MYKNIAIPPLLRKASRLDVQKRQHLCCPSTHSLSLSLSLYDDQRFGSSNKTLVGLPLLYLELETCPHFTSHDIHDVVIHSKYYIPSIVESFSYSLKIFAGGSSQAEHSSCPS